MAVLTESQLQTMVLKLLQVNVSTDPPFSTGAGGDVEDALNRAYRILWEESGGGRTPATHATLWTPSPAALGTQTLSGVLTTVGEILHLWVGTTSGSTGDAAGDTELDRVELSQIEFLRSNTASGSGLGTYAESKLYAVVRTATATPANVNKLTVEVWPASAGTRYYPAHYLPQFTPLDTSTVTTPDLNDIQSYDLGYMAAMELAPLAGRAEFVPSIAANLSESTRVMLERRGISMVEARQDA